MFDLVRKLGVIRNYADYLTALQDIQRLRARGFDLTDEDFIYISETKKHIELFESYLDLDHRKPQPRDLLAYLMARVKKVTAETLEREAGVQDLGSILSGHRPPTGHEARLLGKYFGLPPDDFVFNPVHRLGLIRDYADYGDAKQDIAILRNIEPDLPPEASSYISETEKHIELFERSLDLSRGKPQPRDLLAYLMKEVTNVTTETVEREAGVRNLGTILSGDRPPTYDESHRLSRCFSVKLNAFVFEPRHQLGLIRDYADYLAARRDLEILRRWGFDLRPEEYLPFSHISDTQYISDTQKHIELFESYLGLNRSKPQPRDLLAYLMARVKKVKVKTVEREAGVQNLRTILSGHRLPTSEEARLLSQYFAVSEDAFVWSR